jgi:hypothetical protein
MSAAVTPAPDQTCPIKAGGKIDKCYDDYIMCSPLSYINVKNNGGCEETYKQSIIIDGQEVEHHTIVFDVDASATDCSTEVKRDGKVISKRR